MTLQEAYQVVDYYDVVFLIALFLQEHFKDFLSTLVCFFMSAFGKTVILLYQSWGLSYWESTMFFEATLFFLSIFLIGTRIGWILFFVTLTAFFVNFVGYWMPKGEFYVWYAEHYGVMNIIMFEVLVWACIVNSRLRPYLEKLNQQSTEFLNKQLEKWREHHKKRV